jgi:hypothetical protein
MQVISCLCFDFLVITYLCFDYLVHVAIFSTLGQRWLVRTRSKRRGRPETATRGLLLPRAAPLLPPSRHEVESSSRRGTAPPTSRMQEVGNSSRHCRTAPPPSTDLDDSIEMWVAAPPLTCLAPPPPLTCVEECPHVKEVSSYEHCFKISIV